MIFYKKYRFFFIGLFAALVLFGGVSFFVLTTPTHAESAVDFGVDPVGKATGLPDQDVRVVVANVIRVALGLLGIVSVVIILYGGFLWMTGGGNDDRIDQAKKIITNAAIGLAIILSSYALTTFIIRSLLKATSSGNFPDHCYNGTKDQDETATDCGGSCGVCGGVGQPTFPGGNIFYISSLPPAGEACVRNVHLSIVFNKDVDISTLNENVLVHKKSISEPASGIWKYGDQKNIAVFVPQGNCGNGAVNDCLEPNTPYTLEIKNSEKIKSADNLLTLNCSVKAGCGPVDFTSGSGVDREPPTIKIISPSNNSSLPIGGSVPVNVEFTDDSGMQSLALYQNNSFISSQSLDGCKKSGSLSMSWPTTGLAPGSYTLNAFAFDWVSQKGIAATQLKLIPFHCYDDVLQSDLNEKEKGPPACGGECGSCGGESCQNNNQCASGFCDISNGSNQGICIDKTRIESISPLSGAPGSYVSIGGYYFGEQPGEVYFSKNQNPIIANKGDWVKAQLADCVGSESWSSNQIIVEVPQGPVNGPIMVKTAQIIGRDKVSRQFTDVSNDDWGAKIVDFKITDEVRPGLCSVVPEKGVPGDTIQLLGKNFGLFDNNQDYVLFGQELRGVVINNTWNDSSVKAQVPFLDQGFVGVQVSNNGIKSNGVRFVVNQGENNELPIVSGVTPNRGSEGEYITISGKKFGNLSGAVWFKTGADSEAIIGDTTFPVGCKQSVWQDDQIIVKFPKSKGEKGKKYVIQVKTADNKLTRFDTNYSFVFEDGEPAPGICNLSPVSGPVPFPNGATMTITGEYFGSQSQIYFWKVGAQPGSVLGRTLVLGSDVVSRTENTIVFTPPSTITTGPVVLYKESEKKMSNPAQFTVFDCSKNNNTCTDKNYICCSAGEDRGVCKPGNELCGGTSRSAGYIWRFSTADIPLVPQVVERCDALTDQGKNLPSPAPNVLWDQGNQGGDQHNVCRSAIVTVEFNTLLDQTTINPSTVFVNKCSGVDKNNCLNPVVAKIAADSFSLKIAAGERGGLNRNYLSISPEGNKWEDGSWYQVVLGKNIKASGKISLPLTADKPCSSKDSAYCFVFKTDTKNCRLKSVVVTPYSYWTSILEEPIRQRISGVPESDLTYYGNGLSDQHCIMMDTSPYEWSWLSSNKNYSSIYAGANERAAKVSALANTVGVGLINPDNAVNISATAQLNNQSFTGNSPLTIDLSDPQVVDYWPKCLEACTNAQVGVRFNTTLSLKNLPGASIRGTVQLLKCNDENCLSTVSVLSLNDVLLDDKNDYTVLKLANSVENSAALEPNTIYQVILSATSTNPEAATNQLWSAATIRNPRSWSKPYNQVFTWRFKTKKELCAVSRVAVSPDNYYASSIKEKVVYNAEAYSSPDACSAEGQKIDPWQINWNWSSSDRQVATVTSFSTKGKNQYCTGLCVRKGSDFPFGTNQPPVCGNGKVEAGEDCDSPSKSKGCGLSCLYMGSTASTCGNGVVEPDLGEACDPKNAASSIGCAKDCRHTGSNTFSNVAATSTDASICGNGFIGSGEDCDQAISADSTNPASAFNCSASCKHVGTQISSKWCFDNQFTYGGFGSAEFNEVCQKSISQCGDKVSDPDEDPGCDDPVTGWNSKSCNKFCLKNQSNECVANSEGCDEMGHFKGSSLMYSKPSVCGDAQVGIGEDSFCESSLVGNHKNLTDPWSLVSGVGLGMPSGNPPAQSTDIKATTDRQNNNSSVSGQGKFSVTCGYKTDNECQQVYGGTYGVGDNGCCYAQAKLISTYPLNNTANACPNTYLEAVFDSDINAASLKDNVVIARGANDCKDSEEVTGLVISVKNSNTVENIVWYKRMYLAVKNIFAGLFGADVSAAPTKWCVAPDVGKAEVSSVTENGSTKSTISINLSSPLAFDSDYAVILKNGVKTERGVSVNAGGKNLSWKFSTISTICQLSGVEIKPQQYSFSRAGATTTLFAWSKTNNGVFIQGIPGFYDWEYAWGSANPYVSLQNSTSSENILTAQNKNGEVDVGATVNVTANKYSNQLGFGAAGSSHIVVFLCENPWPPKDLFVAGKGPYTIFPFTDKVGNNDGFDIASDTFNNTSLPGSALTGDGYFNFGTYYCADSGVSGVADDLPYLRGAVQVTSSQLATTSSLKRFFFTNTKNSDAVAIQIFSNPKHLTVKDWYTTNKESGGQGFVGETQQIKIDGNDAITDGNNVYVDALNYSSSSQKIYSNIYLFSINTDAQKDTRQVFEQLVRNLSFNINLTNYGYCGLDAQNPYFQKTCKTDFDCSSGEVCSATIDKLLRNYQRLRDLHAVESILDKFLQENNFAPDFKEGSYLKGQTLSVWPSWSDFNNVVGSSLPVDPINLLGVAGTCSVSTNKFCVQDSGCPSTEKCVIHNSLTGWSTENRRFSFACATTSFAYRYVYSNITSTPYVVRARLEDPGLKIQNQITFNKDFVNTDRFVLNNPYGICNQDQEISTQNQGVCGDGQVNLNKGEQCDPPGTVRYGECSVDKKDQIKIDVCSGACGWVPSSTPFVDCSYLSKCGNSKVEVGEQCDDGKLNGRYNHCAKNCTWPPANPPGYCGDGVVQNASEVCDSFVNVTGKKGVCTSGLSWGKTCDNDNECAKKNDTISYLLGTCTTVDQSRTRYGVDKTTSCNWDCQTVGPYCGDGVVQSEFGEDCDGTQICAIGGASGKKSCTKDCKWADSSPASWWSFDDGEKSFALLGFKVVPVESFFDKLSQSFVKCIDEECPDYVAAGRVKGALSFDGKTSLDSVSSKNVGVPLNHLSVEAWINPRSFMSDYMRVLEKGGYSNLADDKNAGGGFGLQFNPAHQLGLALWNENYKTPSFEVYTKNPLPLNKWSHIVATFEKNGLVHQLKIYVNGILDNYVSQATTTPLLTNTNREMVIGKASWGGDKFDGLLDEIKVYDRTLGIGEIQDRSTNNWVCSLNTSTAGGNVLLGMCGDAKVGVGEACDRGDQNGIPCNPKYGGACTYCAGDCKNVVDVQSKEYCGNGKVEGSELCDIDQDTKIMYSLASTSGTVSVRDDSHRGYQVLSCSDEVQSTTTYKKGSKTCVSSCMSLSSSCIACGAISSEDKSAVVVGGSVVNVTDPSSSNPLLGEIKRMNNGGATGPGDKPTWVYFNGSIELYIAQKKIGQNIWPGTSSSTFVLKTVEQDALGNSPVATMNSNSICSFGDGSNYKMRINDDAFHEFSFPVYNKPASWQNDLILSPVISQINRPFDVRIVTTWVNASPNFYSGFIIPSFGSSVTIERLPTSTGLQYYTSSANEGIWYHGFTYTSTKTNVRSFTVDTSKMNQSLYMFYVRVPQVSITDPGIGRYRDAAQLKVDVYLPESDTNSRHFALPSKTFYLKSALQSDNPSASYWYVFNIARNDRGQSSLDQVIPVDKIVTNLKLF